MEHTQFVVVPWVVWTGVVVSILAVCMEVAAPGIPYLTRLTVRLHAQTKYCDIR